MCDKVVDQIFDIINGTDTVTSIPLKGLRIKSENKRHGVNYEATYTKSFLKLLEVLQLSKEFVFIDVGSGKGKVLLLSAKYGFRKNIGLEFSLELCETAKRNRARWKGGIYRKNIKIINVDVLDYDIQCDENVFYFFNPFDEVVLNKFMKKILNSVKDKFRPVWLIFHNMECHREILNKTGEFNKTGEYILGSIEFVGYSNIENLAL